MIASLRGEIARIGEDSVVVELAGVGLQVYIPAPLRESLRRGERVYLHTHLAVREDALTLYGFETLDERELFSLLLGVNGVGPRLALAALSTLTPDAMRRAVFQEQPEIFSRIPGVGNKTAHKIQFHLKDRIRPEEGFEVRPVMGDLDTDVLGALASLGYSVVEAQAALQSIPRDTPDDLETRLRLALQYFSG